MPRHSAPVAWLRQPDAAALFGMHALLMPATLDPAQGLPAGRG